MPEPKVTSQGRKKCPHCSNGDGEVKEIQTTVPGTKPVLMGYCQLCGGSLT